MSDPNDSPPALNEEEAPLPYAHRRIRSFVLRQGRTTQGQREALEKQWPKFGLELAEGLLDFNQVFGRSAPVILEIGFGNGDSLAQEAEANPDNDYLGVEVHRPGVGALLLAIAEKRLQNIRVFHDDALEVMERCIPDNSLSGLQLYFPDPWHKKRHNKRRIIQPAFVEFAASKMRQDALFKLATDWQDYAEHMMEVMSASNSFKNEYGEGSYSPRPQDRPKTKFEQRGQRLGHGVWDLVFQRV